MQTGDFTGYGCPASPLNAALPALAELNLNHIATLPTTADMAAGRAADCAARQAAGPATIAPQDPETERDGSSGETPFRSIGKAG